MPGQAQPCPQAADGSQYQKQDQRPGTGRQQSAQQYGKQDYCCHDTLLQHIRKPPIQAQLESWALVRPKRLSRVRYHANAVSISLRSEEHTSELQSLMRISYAVFCLKK